MARALQGGPWNCTHIRATTTTELEAPTTSTSTHQKAIKAEDWQVMSFPKRRSSQKQYSQNHNSKNLPREKHSQVSVAMDDTEASASASSVALTIAETRANDHPETIDMTDVVMLISSLSTPSLTTHQHHNHSLTNLTNSIEAQKPNGKYNGFIPPNFQRTNDPYINTSSPQQTPNIIGGTGTHGENYNALHHGGGPTNCSSDRGYSMNGRNNQGGNGQNNQGTK
ncbi:hypothetical protein P3L10_007693 [Capsicum annuum]